MTPLLAHSVVIDGTTVRYGIHRGGLRNGHIHTLIGDFASMDELERYVRGRNTEEDAVHEVRAKNSSGGKADGENSGLVVWPGVYYLPHEHGKAHRQEPE